MNPKHLQLTPSQHLLCLALKCQHDARQRTHIQHLIDQVDMPSLVQDALIDELAPHLHVLLTTHNMPNNKTLQHHFDQTQHRITILMNQLDDVAHTLHAQHIPIIALKNAGITRGIFQEPGLSPMGDIDLLIQPKYFHQAHDIILGLGYTFKFRSKYEKEDIKEAFLHGGTEYVKEVEGTQVWLELQWRPIAGRWIQEDNEPKADELFERSISIEGTPVRLLCNEDNLIQVCLHTTKHSYVRAPGFRLHSDVDRIVSLTTIDWEVFLNRVTQLRVKTACYFSLLLPKLLLGTPIPDHVLLTLKPNPIKRFLLWTLIRRAGLFNQQQSKFSKVSYLFFIMLLYDSPSIFIRGVFPPIEQLKKQYPFDSIWVAPYMYVKRLINLVFVRHNL